MKRRWVVPGRMAAAAACAALASMGCGASPASPTAEESLFDVLVGTWVGPEGADCSVDAHAISFSADRRHMFLTYITAIEWPGGSFRTWRYEILSTSSESLRTRIVDPPEYRLTDDGEPVVWDLVVFSRNEYRWRRTDWPPDGYSFVVTRCPG